MADPEITLENIGMLRRIGRILRRYPRDIIRWHLDSWFDRRYGVDTSGKLVLSSLGIRSPHLAEATWYEPVPTVQFRRLIRHLNIPHEQYVFIDFGSGKGRALFLAAEYPFKEVIGLEFSRQLHEIAERNIQTYRSSRQRAQVVRSVCIDAVDFKLPSAKSVLFFYSPFKASVFEKILYNVKRSLAESPRSVYLVFIGFLPASVRVLKASGLDCVEIPLGTDYIRWEKKVGLILHSESGVEPPPTN